MALGDLHDPASGLKEQLFAVRVCGQGRAVARQARPSASARQFIELAVNMPEHDPQVGQAFSLDMFHLLIGHI